MCVFDTTVHTLADVVELYVRFANSQHASDVAKGSRLPMSHHTTQWVYAEAERLYELFRGDEAPPRARQILAEVGIPDPNKGRDCRRTQISALREAIRDCAPSVAERLRQSPVEVPIGVNPQDFECLEEARFARVG